MSGAPASIDTARRREPARRGGSRVPPHNLEAEESVLGAMLLSREAIGSALEVGVKAADFYKPAHGHIYEAVTTLYGQGEPADPVTVAEVLRRQGLLESIGGGPALVSLEANTPAINNAARYARIVEEHSLLRRLIGAAGEIAEISYGLPEDVTAAVDDAESLIFAVADRRVTDSMLGIRQVLERQLDRIETLYENGEHITGVPTGFIDLDNMLSGLQPSNLILVGGRPSSGKALALDTPIPTPTGWTTMGRIQAGDTVLGADGRACNVVFATEVMCGRTCYEVTFDDGATLVADADHQWFAYDLPAWKAKREQQYRLTGYLHKPQRNPNLARDQSRRRRLPRVVTTQQMLDEGLTAGDGRPNWYVPLTAPLELPEAQLPLDPYLLGVWLGDGHTWNARVTTADQEIVDAFDHAGFRTVTASPAGAATTYSITRGRSCSHPLAQSLRDSAVLSARKRVASGVAIKEVVASLVEAEGAVPHSRRQYVRRVVVGAERRYVEPAGEPYFLGLLKELGLIGNKHVPEQYLRASRAQRLALLQGLLDTDGYVSNGQVELTLSNRPLLDQARELVLSLGHKPGRVRRKLVALHDGREAEAWRFAWTPPETVFRLPRKVAVQASARRPQVSEATRRVVRSIRVVDSVPVRCISVDSADHLYLAGEAMVPTHNTALALNIASHAALNGTSTLVFSIEMNHLEIGQRLLSCEARVDAGRIRNGRLLETDWPKISEATGRLSEAPIHIDDNPHLTVMELRAKARRHKSRYGLGLVIVDYLQLMTGRHAAETRQVEVSEISRGLKILARELNVPVVALSQLSRNPDQRADKRPVLSDLRESGSQEQDADLVLFVHRPEMYDPNTPDRGMAEIIVAKQRNGPTGSVKLAFLEAYTKFANMARV